MNIYQLSRVQVISVLNHPVRVTGVVLALRLKFTLSQCFIAMDRSLYQYPMDTDYIKSMDKLTWWRHSMESCKENNLVIVCNKRSLTKNYDDCLTNLFVHANPKFCSNNLYPHSKTHVLHTTYGLLVCNHIEDKEITIFKHDALDIIRVYKNPFNFNYTEGNQVMIDDQLFDIPKAELVWNIPTYHVKSSFSKNINYMKEQGYTA